MTDVAAVADPGRCRGSAEGSRRALLQTLHEDLLMDGFRADIEEKPIGSIERPGRAGAGGFVVDELAPNHLGSIIDDTEIGGRKLLPRVGRVGLAGSLFPSPRHQAPAGSSILFESARRPRDRMISTPGMRSVRLPGAVSAGQVWGSA